MSEGVGITLALCALFAAEPPPIQRPQGADSVPIQRPKTAAPKPDPAPVTPPPPTAEPSAPESATEPAPPPSRSLPNPFDQPAPELSESDKAAELEEFTDILEPLPPEPDPELEPDAPPPPVRARLDPADIVRSGVTVSAAVGVSLCGHDWCDAYRAGFGGQVEAGVRLGRWMPHASLDGGSGSDDLRTLEELINAPRGSLSRGSTSFLGAGVGLTVFLKKQGRFDPYITTRLGYTRTRSSFGGRLSHYTETVSRGSVRLGGGFDVYFGRNIAFGPRFDVTIGFAGRVCTGGRSSEAEECYPVRNIEETARIYAQDLPVPVFVGAQLRGVIPWPGSERWDS